MEERHGRPWHRGRPGAPGEAAPGGLADPCRAARPVRARGEGVPHPARGEGRARDGARGARGVAAPALGRGRPRGALSPRRGIRDRLAALPSPPGGGGRRRPGGERALPPPPSRPPGSPPPRRPGRGGPLPARVFAARRALPPLLIHVGSDEVLLDDAVQLAERAKAAGVPATLEVWDGMIHVWHWFLPMLEEAETAIETIGRFCRKSMG